jgi:xylan 1,4-beta-xylosidase
MKESGYPEAKRYYTEWSSSPSSRDCSHDYMPAAVYVMKTLLEGIDLYDCLSYWTFTDIFEEQGGGNAAFHGGFGMVNFQGIVKPVWHAFRMMHNLGTQLVCNQEGLVVTKTEEGKVSAIRYVHPESFSKTVPIHYYPDHEGAQAIELTGEPVEVDILFEGLMPNATIELEYVDCQNGCAMEAYKRMGRPISPSKEAVKELKEAALATQVSKERADNSGTYHLKRAMQAWSMLAIREL